MFQISDNFIYQTLNFSPSRDYLHLNMTLPEFSERTMEHCKNLSKSIGDELNAAIKQALEEGRITCGIFACAELLEIYPEKAMFCILPEVTSDDVTVRIQHTLTEAYCAENDIRIIKVSSSQGLEKLVQGVKTSTDNPLAMMKSYCNDFTCVILEFPKTEPSEEDKCLAKCLSSALYGYHQPIIDLPV